jgi:hypothetical protein
VLIPVFFGCTTHLYQLEYLVVDSAAELLAEQRATIVVVSVTACT